MNQPQLCIGGVVDAGALYVRREADDELLEHLLANRSCYVLGPSQIGKSSLIAATMRDLGTRGVASHFMLASEVGGRPETWLDEFYAYWAQLAGPTFSPSALASRAERLCAAFGVVAAGKPYVIVIDEINELLRIGLGAARRGLLTALQLAQMLKARGDPGLRHVSFVLAGFVSPDDLRGTAEEGPVTYAAAIELYDFAEEEVARTFGPLFTGVDGEASEWTAAVYRWTSGHPYLTQFLCDRLLRAARTGELAWVEHVDDLVGRWLRDGKFAHMPVFRFVRTRLELLPAARQHEVVRLYRGLREAWGTDVPAVLRSERRDQTQIDARIVALAGERMTVHGPRLQVRCRMFAEVFDVAWCDRVIKDLDRPLRTYVQAWLANERDPTFLLSAPVYLRMRHADTLTLEEKEFMAASSAKFWRFVVACMVTVVLFVVGLFVAAVFLRRYEVERARKLAMDEVLARSPPEVEALKEVAKKRRAEVQEVTDGVERQTIFAEAGVELLARLGEALHGDLVQLDELWSSIAHKERAAYEAQLEKTREEVVALKQALAQGPACPPPPVCLEKICPPNSVTNCPSGQECRSTSESSVHACDPWRQQAASCKEDLKVCEFRDAASLAQYLAKCNKDLIDVIADGRERVTRLATCETERAAEKAAANMAKRALETEKYQCRMRLLGCK